MRTVVLGVGNVLLQDEGFGVHAVEALARRYELPASVEIVDGGTTGMELLPQLEGADHLIVVDAVRAGQEEGALVRLEGEQVPAFFKTKLSPHQVGLSDILAALAFKGDPPGHVVLIGVKPVSMALDLALSPKVQARLDEAVDWVVAELDAIGEPPRPRLMA